MTDRRVEAATRALVGYWSPGYQVIEDRDRAVSKVMLAAADAVDAPALAEARQLLAAITDFVDDHRHDLDDTDGVSDFTEACELVERARRFLTDQETT